ncbi:MAG: cupin domain-containing protein [Actinomycetota bacterium]
MTRLRPRVRMRRLAAIASACVVGVAGVALATPGSGITDVVNLVQATNPHRVKANDGPVELKLKAPTDVLVQTATFQPGSTSGWHGHPGFVILAVKSGTLTRYDEHCRAQGFTAGQAFVEEGRDHAVLVRNEGLEAAVVYITYVVPQGDLPIRRIDMPNPGCTVQ